MSAENDNTHHRDAEGNELTRLHKVFFVSSVSDRER